MATRAVPRVVVVVASVLVCVPALADAQVAAPCIARPAERFHLRPRSTDASVGIELAAGTPLAVLSADNTLRGGARLFAVRVSPAGPSGYMFLRAFEFDATCPEPWVLPFDAANEAAIARSLPVAEWVRPGVAATAAASVLPGDEAASVEQSADYDGDGQVDNILRVRRGPLLARLLALHTAQGWQSQLLSTEGEDGGCEWLPAMVRGADTWVPTRCLSSTESGYTDESWDVYHFDRGARVLRRVGTLQGDRLSGGDSEPHPTVWRFAATAPGVLTVTGHRGAARSFHLDATRGWLSQ